MLPVLGATLLLIAASASAGLAAFGGTGDVSRWAAISTIWLVIPVMLLGIVILAVFVAIIYLLGRFSRLIPSYSSEAQRVAQRVEGAAKRGADMVRRPLLAVREVGAILKARLQRARERM